MKWLIFLPSQKQMFLKSLDGSHLGVKVNFAEGRKLECLEKALVRLRSTNLSPRAKPRIRSRVIEVGGKNDNC